MSAIASCRSSHNAAFSEQGQDSRHSASLSQCSSEDDTVLLRTTEIIPEPRDGEDDCPGTSNSKGTSDSKGEGQDEASALPIKKKRIRTSRGTKRRLAKEARLQRERLALQQQQQPQQPQLVPQPQQMMFQMPHLQQQTPQQLNQFQAASGAQSPLFPPSTHSSGSGTLGVVAGPPMVPQELLYPRASQQQLQSQLQQQMLQQAPSPIPSATSTAAIPQPLPPQCSVPQMQQQPQQVQGNYQPMWAQPQSQSQLQPLQQQQLQSLPQQPQQQLQSLGFAPQVYPSTTSAGQGLVPIGAPTMMPNQHLNHLNQQQQQQHTLQPIGMPVQQAAAHQTQQQQQQPRLVPCGDVMYYQPNQAQR